MNFPGALTSGGESWGGICAFGVGVEDQRNEENGRPMLFADQEDVQREGCIRLNLGGLGIHKIRLYCTKRVRSSFAGVNGLA